MALSALARGVARRGEQQFAALPFGLVADLPPQFTPAFACRLRRRFNSTPSVRLAFLTTVHFISFVTKVEDNCRYWGERIRCYANHRHRPHRRRKVGRKRSQGPRRD